MKNFINISDCSVSELRAIIEEAKNRKKIRKDLNKSAPDEDKPFEGKSMAMIFEKPSTRTRMSFDIAVKQLGGSSIILNPDGIHYGKGDETLKDTAKVLSEYVDIVMLRTSKHKNLEEFGKYLSIPIINGLSDESHPCQIMSDILTYEETHGPITGKIISWIGDGNNNMSNSLIEAAAKFKFHLKIGCPKKYSPDKKILVWAKKNKVNLLLTQKPEEAVKNSDCVMTDKWVSMNDKENKKKKKKILKHYQVNKKLMMKANSDAIFMHCLPVGRNEEVTDDVIDGKQSVVWRQASNRVHAQKSIIKWCLN
ncbi:MAG: ornithine carbamoyltransferase [Candidatus Pelagibacter sp.]|nr:ornithine carbamoyltransferase [Candidatus Pelagibacter sp.]|tara:strand:- start:2118 stop:3044 length:927 start_codon:yes stop_codon:yes gene_type:complete